MFNVKMGDAKRKNGRQGSGFDRGHNRGETVKVWKCTMRAACMTADFLDISETVKMLIGMPKGGHVELLKILGGGKRMVIVHGKQNPRDALLHILVDSNWA